jgi:putative hydrolase of the HAD superfamily
VLHVGNDVLNDVLPAAAIGFRTALFAGDRRSLRRRDGDPRVASITPDIVLIHLRDLLSCVRRHQES